MNNRRQIIPVIGSLAISLTITLALAALGRVNRLALPPLTDADARSAWWDNTSRLDIVMASLRGLCLVFALYVTTVLLISLAAVASNQITTAQSALRLLPTWFRFGLAGTLGTALVLGKVVGAPTSEVAPTTSQSTTTTASSVETTLPQTTSTTAAAPQETTTTATPVQEPASTREPTQSTVVTYTIQPGDHLWSIAQAELARRNADRLVTDREITTYWKRLCKANVDNLRDPSNFDLIFPGDTLIIPE